MVNTMVHLHFNVHPLFPLRVGPPQLSGAGTRKVRHTLQELHDGEEIARGSGMCILCLAKLIIVDL